MKRESFLNVPVMLLVYAILLFITAFFSRTFFLSIISASQPPSPLQMAVFLTVPVIMLALGLYFAGSLLRGALRRQQGGKVQIHLVLYFAGVAVLAAAPVMLISIRLFYDTTRYWKQISAYTALEEAEGFVFENYELKLDRFTEIQKTTDFEQVMARFSGYADPAAATGSPDFPGGGLVAAVQEFECGDGGVWLGGRFIGAEAYRLENAPSGTPGFIAREMPRDRDVVRFAERAKTESGDLLRCVTYSLGKDFDAQRTHIEREKNVYADLGGAMTRIRNLLVLCYAVFFLPCLLIALIIAMTFARDLTGPLLALSLAARRVAEGDFSVQVSSEARDELSGLVTSFNEMVREMEKTRVTMMREEKISV